MASFPIPGYTNKILNNNSDEWAGMWSVVHACTLTVGIHMAPS